MKFTVTITVQVEAPAEQAAWEYGKALSARDPASIHALCHATDEDEATVEVRAHDD